MSQHHVSETLFCVAFVTFFFDDTATTEIYTLSLHDALPISGSSSRSRAACLSRHRRAGSNDRRSGGWGRAPPDRKSTRLNSSHANISYAVFCLKKKKKRNQTHKRLK